MCNVEFHVLCTFKGLAFVEQLSKILEQKCIREVVRSLHEQRWLQFLLDLVDVTKAGADEHLVVYFIKANSQVLKKHQTELFEKVCATILY